MSETKHIYYRVRREYRKHYRPWDGGLYREVRPPNEIGYALIELGPRDQAIPVQNFERVELEDA